MLDIKEIKKSCIIVKSKELLTGDVVMGYLTGMNKEYRLNVGFLILSRQDISQHSKCLCIHNNMIEDTSFPSSSRYLVIRHLT